MRLDALVKRSPRRNSAVITDTRGNWAARWIIPVARAGFMEVYPNYTFQPGATVRRGDLANAARNVLLAIAAENPRLGAAWRNARRKFPDLQPGHLSYPAAATAVEAGVMQPLEGGVFGLSRPVTGAEAVSSSPPRTLLAITTRRMSSPSAVTSFRTTLFPKSTWISN
jgi:hypothetical protein